MALVEETPGAGAAESKPPVLLEAAVGTHPQTAPAPDQADTSGDEADRVKAARRKVLADNRKLLTQLPVDCLFEVPGRPSVAYQIKDYSRPDTLRELSGREAARKDVPFLFRAFETGQQRPPQPGSKRASQPRAFTIHEYLDWTATACEPASIDDLDFSGFRIVELVPRFCPAWPSPGLYAFERRAGVRHAHDRGEPRGDRRQAPPAGEGEPREALPDADRGSRDSASGAPTPSQSGGASQAGERENGLENGGAQSKAPRPAPEAPPLRSLGPREAPDLPGVSACDGVDERGRPSGRPPPPPPLELPPRDEEPCCERCPSPRRRLGLGGPRPALPALQSQGPALCAAAVRLGAGFLEVPFYATHEARRNRGHGRALLEAIEDVCRALGVRHILLCSTDDARTRGTWQSLGFRLCGDAELDALGVTHHDLLHMDNTVQMLKEVPAQRPWTSLLLRHGPWAQRVYRLPGYVHQGPEPDVHWPRGVGVPAKPPKKRPRKRI